MDYIDVYFFNIVFTAFFWVVVFGVISAFIKELD